MNKYIRLAFMILIIVQITSLHLGGGKNDPPKTTFADGTNVRIYWTANIPYKYVGIKSQFNDRFIVDTGSPRDVTLSKNEMIRLGKLKPVPTQISISDVVFPVRPSGLKYQPYNVLGTGFFQKAKLSLMKKPSSHTFYINANQKNPSKYLWKSTFAAGRSLQVPMTVIFQDTSGRKTKANRNVIVDSGANIDYYERNFNYFSSQKSYVKATLPAPFGEFDIDSTQGLPDMISMARFKNLGLVINFQTHQFYVFDNSTPGHDEL